MMSQTFGLFTQMSDSGPHGPFVLFLLCFSKCDRNFMTYQTYYISLYRELITVHVLRCMDRADGGLTVTDCNCTKVYKAVKLASFDPHSCYKNW